MKLKFTHKTWYFFLLCAAAASMLNGFAVLGGMDFSFLEMVAFCITGITILFLAAEKGSDPKDKRSYFLIFVLLMLSYVLGGWAAYLFSALVWPALLALEYQKGRPIQRQLQLVGAAEAFHLLFVLLTVYGGMAGLSFWANLLWVLLACARGLSLEAWVNPYRLRSSASMPPVLAENSLPNTHPEWVCTVNEGAYLNPAIPEAADYVVQGVAELVQNYAVDGIHFDDYFYPTTDPSIDAAQFAASGETDLTAWRRANVTRLVKAAHDAVKAADPTLRFGVSPQGNPDNDRNEQYTDLSVWLTASGADAVVDYLCPQIYWGYGYTLSSGSTRFAFENITAEWLALPRAESTALYFGLGAYRVGVGDGGANADSVSQWCTGSALARQVTDLRSAGAGGWALYRYGSLFRSDESGLAAAERAALTALDG